MTAVRAILVLGYVFLAVTPLVWVMRGPRHLSRPAEQDRSDAAPVPAAERETDGVLA